MSISTRLFGILALFSACLACAATPEPPLRTEPWPTPSALLVWHGTGTAHRIDDGEWHRIPEHDYDFTVVQRRYATHWESTKTMHRRHPDYDGSAGPREQASHFSIDYANGATFKVDSSLGAGSGTTDETFSEATMRIAADVSRFAPFNHYQIDQRYDYEDGRLQETVRLLAGDTPWVRIEEDARMFWPHRFETPPSRLVSSAR